MKTILKTIGAVLALQLVLGAGYLYWVLSTPDDVLSTVQVSREWIAKLYAQQGQQAEHMRELEQMLQQMGNTCELMSQHGRKVM